LFAICFLFRDDVAEYIAVMREIWWNLGVSPSFILGSSASFGVKPRHVQKFRHYRLIGVKEPAFEEKKKNKP